MKEKLMFKKVIRDNLSDVEPFNKRNLKLLFPEHHLSHAASAFYPSGFQDAAILTIDGVGEWTTTSLCHGTGNQLKIMRELRFPHSVGLLYSAFTYFLGFRVNSGEYKLMGLAPYGNPTSNRTQKFIDQIKSELVDIKEDGSIFLNQNYFSYATRLRMVRDRKWEQLFGIPKRRGESELSQEHSDLAYAIQHVTEEIVLKMAQAIRNLTGSRNLCMAGGVALNCVANGRIADEKIFDDIFIQPAAGDAGGALGAALAANYLYFGQERNAEDSDMQAALLGPEFSPTQIRGALRKFNAKFTHFESFDELSEKVARLISEGNIIGNFQGKMEYGPRALGNRSIIADPRNEEMQKKLNLKIKFRESFRPFAPAVLEEHAAEYFDMQGTSPYMLRVHRVKESKRNIVPGNYAALPVKEKLYQKRSEIQAITHVDFSARIQTVSQKSNPRFHKLINAFYKHTGCPILVNTSFNVRGEPIVCTPEEAYKCFMRTNMDFLALGDYLLSKDDQPEWQESSEWEKTYPLD